MPLSPNSLHSILKWLLRCQTSPPHLHSPLALMKAAADGYDLTLRPKLWHIKSSRIRTRRDTVREHCKRTDSLSVNICDSGSASQGMNLSLCPFLTLKSPMGPGGCGKWEARSLLNSCVIEFPHNTANVCMDAGTSVPKARRVKQGPKIPRAHLVSKQ